VPARRGAQGVLALKPANANLENSLSLRSGLFLLDAQIFALGLV
jgi:hypothetical protein